MTAPACAESLCMATMCRSGSLHHFKPCQAPGTKVTFPRAQGLSGLGAGDIALNTGRVLAAPFQLGAWWAVGGAAAAAVSRGQHSAWHRVDVQPTKWKTACSSSQRVCWEDTVGTWSRGRSTVQSVPLATTSTGSVRLPLSQGKNRAVSGRGPRSPLVPRPPTRGASTYSAPYAAPWGLWWALYGVGLGK